MAFAAVALCYWVKESRWLLRVMCKIAPPKCFVKSSLFCGPALHPYFFFVCPFAFSHILPSPCSAFFSRGLPFPLLLFSFFPLFFFSFVFLSWGLSLAVFFPLPIFSPGCSFASSVSPLPVLPLFSFVFFASRPPM